ncbi:MAG: discoidin domain-containing protein [Candidatus Nealsonbacteria bacterium]|nr:discoidin domain-containing protein [Candidatus Nealsonbacteria bacterium]
MRHTSSIWRVSVALFATLSVTLGPMSAGMVHAQADDTWDTLTREFREPPLQRKSRPLWFWNGLPTAEETARQMEKLCEIGYAGVAILPGGGKGNRGPGLPFMSPEYLQQYKVAADTAKRLGMKMCLYDEYWFPSGYAGGLLAKQYPEALSKRLDRTVFSAKGPGPFEREVKLPDGARLMGVVAVRDADKQRVDVSAQLSQGVFHWDVPEGEWRIQTFVCVPDGARGLVDYLEPESVGKFYELTYEAYRRAMPEHFGTTIDSAFYDEPTFHWIDGGRAWTPRFNEYFQQRFGFNPVPLYPALWEDIGPDTAAARNTLFGFRATLFSEGFVKTIAERLAEHGVPLTGHLDQEEIVNPVGLCGDLMKAFQYQPIPGLDQVFKYGRGSKMYKIISSAAYNYDRSLVMTEVYGGEGRIPIEMLYREAMDQAAKGVNLFVPHAVWYDATPEQINFQPELSHRDPLYGKALPAYNRYIGRIQGLLQPPARHVADVAVLYPIASLQAAYHFDGPLKPYAGGVVPEEADYMDLGETLSLRLRRDYTFVHPDVVETKLRVVGNTLIMENKINREQFRVFVMPGMRAIRVGTLRKVLEFYRAGGQVIATTRLPDRSAEPRQSDEVARLIREIFGHDTLSQLKKTRSQEVKASASSSFAGSEHSPQRAIDSVATTRWNSAAQSGNDQWLALEFGKPKTIARIEINEAFDRVRRFRLQGLNVRKNRESEENDAADAWADLHEGATIGAAFSLKLEPPQTCEGLRLVFDEIDSDCLSIRELALFAPDGSNLLPGGDTMVARNENAAGGRAWFLQTASEELLRSVLDEAVAVPDVRFADLDQLPAASVQGEFSYLHRRIAKRDVWFFANSSDRAVETTVRLRGQFDDLQWWNPHNGDMSPAAAAKTTGGSIKVTDVELRLPPVRSVFLVGREIPR